MITKSNGELRWQEKRRKDNYILFIILVGIIAAFLPLCSASEVYPAYQNVELKFTCTLNDAIPSPAAVYNFTISYPNGTTFIDNAEASPLGQGSFYYNTNFTIIGTYKVQSFCYEGAYSYSNTEFIEVTYTGMKPTTAQSGLSIGIILSIIFIMFFFGFIGFKLIEYEKLYPVGVFFLLVSIIIAVYGLYLGVVYSRDFLSSATSNPQSKIFIGILYGLTGMMFISLLWLVIKAVGEIRERKSIQKHGENYNPKTKQYEY